MSTPTICNKSVADISDERGHIGFIGDEEGLNMRGILDAPRFSKTTEICICSSHTTGPGKRITKVIFRGDRRMIEFVGRHLGR
jgi:hypothetical protein